MSLDEKVMRQTRCLPERFSGLHRAGDAGGFQEQLRARLSRLGYL